MLLRREFLAVPTSLVLLANERSGKHHVYRFNGTPYDVGLQHGKALKQEIRTEAQAAADRLKGGPEAFLARNEPYWREHLPNALEEIHGLSDGAELSYPFAFFAATRDFTREGACTAVACSGRTTTNGHVLIGQTKDTEAPLDRFRLMHISYASGRSMMVLNYPGWIANLCLTSDGVATTGNSLYAAPPDRPTVPGSLLKRLIMEKRSTQEVLDSVRGMIFENACIMIGDRPGHVVCLEFIAGRTHIRDVSGQAFGHANNILAGDLQEYQRALGSPSSPLRQASIDRILGAQTGHITTGSLEAALRDHRDYPLSICRHPSLKDPNLTNAAFVADLNALEMRIAIGNPCVAPFLTYQVASITRA